MITRTTAAITVAAAATALLAGCTAGSPEPAPTTTATVTVTPTPEPQPRETPSQKAAPVPVPAPTEDSGLGDVEEKIIQDYRTEDPSDTSSDADILLVAHQVCQVFDNQGVAVGMDTIQSTAQQTGVNSRAMATLIINAVTYYCPSYGPDLREWIATQPGAA